MNFGKTLRDNDLLTIFVPGFIKAWWHCFTNHLGKMLSRKKTTEREAILYN